MKFSLVLATINRTEELMGFLQSLEAQTHRNFELIIVDQNQDDRLQPIIKIYQQKYTIYHIRTKPGLSKARNAGLNYATGDIIAFPDDDCSYPPRLLENITRFFENNPEIDGLTGRAIDKYGRVSVGRWAKQPGRVNKYNVWVKAVSITIFLRKAVVLRVGGFDERLGAGSGTPWGSSEETDYLIRALEKGFRIYYDPSIRIHHPQPLTSFDEQALRRGVFYGGGMGFVLRKHDYPLWNVLHHWARPLGGALASLLLGKIGKARYHWSIFTGRVRGWMEGGRATLL